MHYCEDCANACIDRVRFHGTIYACKRDQPYRFFQDDLDYHPDTPHKECSEYEERK